MSLLERQVSASLTENALNKKMIENSYKAVVNSKMFKETSRRPKKVVYEKSSLLDKIITSNLNDNASNKRLEQISYSAINGQRQEEGTYKPEGVQMLGQMGREKPLTAITKEMIQQYQEEEQARPFMIDGEARKYMGATYEPQFPVSFENLKTTDEIDAIISRYRQGRTDINNEIANIDSDIKETTDKIASIRNEINEKGSNLSNLYALRNENNNLDKLHKERKKLEKDVDAYNYDLQNLDINRNEIIRHNSLINQKNREEVLKYEQSLQSMNRNRLNLQQQPYESEYDYYKRLKEVEKEKFDPTLYKKYASNENTKQLKSNLDELFSDVSFKEDIIKNINDDDKFMINKLFDKVSKSYLNEYGFNNTRLSPRMTAEALIRILNSIKGTEISPLQAIIKRNKQREIYADAIALARDRQDLEARKAEQQTEQQAAATLLQARMKRRPQREIYADTIALARDRQDLEARKAEQQTATNIQRVLRGHLGRSKAVAAQKRAIERRQEIADKYAEREARQLELASKRQAKQLETTQQIAKDQKYMQRLARAQAIAQENEQEQMQKQLQTLAQAHALSKKLKEDDRIIKEEKARNIIKSAILRSKYQPDFRVYKKYQDKQEAKKKAKQYMQNQEAYLKDIEERLPYLEEWVKFHKEQQEKEIAPQKELLKREMMYKPASLIQSVLRGHKGRQQFKTKQEEEMVNRLVEASIEAQQAGQMQQLSPTATALSGATTLAEQEQERLRKQRSDIGSTRAPYKTKKKQEKEMMKTLTPEERRILYQGRVQSKTRAQSLAEIAKQREEAAKAKGAKGSGFRKPPRRQVTVSQTEKKKDRLRLVAAQIKAGNTNPKLIVEVNKLYKDLYNIDNAYMMLK